jgi:hypothetical protein
MVLCMICTIEPKRNNVAPIIKAHAQYFFKKSNFFLF